MSHSFLFFTNFVLAGLFLLISFRESMAGNSGLSVAYASSGMVFAFVSGNWFSLWMEKK